MSDTNTPPATPPADTGTPPPPPPPPPADTPPSNLPSDTPNPDLIGGKWENTEAMLEHIKTMEDKYANAQRELANGSTPPPADTPPADTPPAADEAAMVAQQTLVENELMPEFMKNGMIITPEMISKAVAVGIDERDLKLGAYEMKESLGKSFAVTGGQENYTAMIEWGKATLNDAQKAEFDKALNSGMSEYAVKGLWQDFQAAGGVAANGGTPPARVEGNTAAKGLQPYADRRELYKDKDYIESPAGRRDRAAIDKYRARLRITPNTVLGI